MWDRIKAVSEPDGLPVSVDEAKAHSRANPDAEEDAIFDRLIRAAVALYMVAASIPGRSVVKNADTIKRARPDFVENLRSLGADVEWK